MEHEYPMELCYKLYDRMGKSLVELAKYSDAISSFEKAKDSLKASKLDVVAQRQLFKDIDKLIEVCRLSLDNGKSDKLSTDSAKKVILPNLSASCNKRFPCASSSMDIKLFGTRGRYSIAQGPVSVGDVLLVEKPYASIMSPEYTSTHCHHCLNETLAPIACFQCSSLRYCSQECRELSWSAYQKLECKFLNVVHDSGVGKMAHLAWRVVNTTGRLGLQLKINMLVNSYQFFWINKGCTCPTLSPFIPYCLTPLVGLLMNCSSTPCSPYFS